MNEPVVGMLAERLGSNAEALCAWVTTNEPAIAEFLAREAFDAVALDMQHGAVDFAGAMRLDRERRARRQADDRAGAGRGIRARQPAPRRRRERNSRAR